LVQASGPAPAGAAPGALGLHLAIRHRRFAPVKEAALTMPRAPDAEGPVLRKGPSAETPEIAALILSTDATATGRLLESLAFQTAAAALRVDVRLGPEAAGAAGEIGRALERLFPGRARLAPAGAGLGADIAAAFGEEATRFVLVAR